MRFGSGPEGTAGAGVCAPADTANRETVKDRRDKPIFIIFREFLKVIFTLAREKPGEPVLLGLDVRLSQRGFLARARNSNIIDDPGSAGRSGHTSSGALVLAYGGVAFPGHNTSLDAKAKAVFANFGLGKLGPYFGFQFRVADRQPLLTCGCGFAWGAGGANGCQGQERKEKKN